MSRGIRRFGHPVTFRLDTESAAVLHELFPGKGPEMHEFVRHSLTEALHARLFKLAATHGVPARFAVCMTDEPEQAA